MFFLISVFVTWQVIAAPVSQLSFVNFNQEVTLVQQGEGFKLQGSNHRVHLSNRLILKLATHLSKKNIFQYHPDILTVTELYSGNEYNYYLLTAKGEGFPYKLFNSLVNKQASPDSAIKLVQPDMLQVRTKAEQSSTNALAKAPYIELLAITKLWQQTKGQGVNVAIIDDGFELNHPDLKHVTSVFSYDAETRQTLATPQTKRDRHGTKVAGIIFAKHNDEGIDGIAPEANLIAIRQPDTWTSNTLLSFQLAKLAGADIINCSWHSNFLLQPLEDVVNDLAVNGRDGKGTAIVWAAGNKGRALSKNMHEAAIELAITVGAVDENGQRISFSNYGDVVDFYNYGDATTTTIVKSRRGDDYGYFSGTSLAAAITSGLAALLIAKQPDIALTELIKQLKVRSQLSQMES